MKSDKHDFVDVKHMQQNKKTRDQNKVKPTKTTLACLSATPTVTAYGLFEFNP